MPDDAKVKRNVVKASPVVLAIAVLMVLVWWFAFHESISVEKRVAEEIAILKDTKPGSGTTDYASANRLAQLGPEAVPFMITALQHEDPQVRQGVAYALGKIGPEASDAIPVLVAAINDKDRHVVWRATESLGKMGPVAVPHLIDVLSGKNRGNRAAAAAVLGVNGPDAAPAVPVLIVILQDDTSSWLLLNETVKTLGAIGPQAKAAVPSLLALNTEEKAREIIFTNVIDALSHIIAQDEEYIPTLVENLNSEDERVSRTAALVLPAIGPAAVSPLVKALKSEILHARCNAAFGLSYCGQRFVCAEEAVPALIEALKDENQIVRSTAAEALGEFGPDAVPAVPALTEALDDEDKSVRNAAEQAIEKIAPEQP